MGSRLTYNHAGKIIKQKRIELGIRQNELARMLGYTRQFQNMLEKGEKNLPISRVVDVCFLLKIDPVIINDALIRSACDKLRAKL